MRPSGSKPNTLMPTIVPYKQVLDRLRALGLCSLYHNSGAFGFQNAQTVHYRGWIGPADGSIRDEAKPHTRNFLPPYEQSLAAAAARAWVEHLGGVVWMMPMSHWSYELDFGSRAWMPAALAAAGVDAAQLAGRADGSAIEFLTDEVAMLQALLSRLLSSLTASDFMLVFPARPALCTVHHHKQLWWQTTDEDLMNLIHSG